MKLNCKVCGKEYIRYGKQIDRSVACSFKCLGQYNTAENNINCTTCNKEFHMKESEKIRYKRTHGYFCSIKCHSVFKETNFLGENNHQKGLIGHFNSSFSGKETITNHGYVLEYCPGHPRPNSKAVKGSRVRQHRLVVENNSHLFSEDFFEDVNGFKVLKLGYDVHHINGVKTDNRLENLQIMTRGDHTTLHNKAKEIIRDSKNGRIIGVKRKKI